MTKAIIIEDEIHGMNNLKAMLGEHCSDVKVIGEATNNKEGLKLLARSDIKPDVAFLDINLPDGPIFNLLNELNGKIDFDIIFVTAHEKFAVKACQYSSIYFIVKPLDSEQLKEAVSRINKDRNNNKIEQRLEVFSQHYNNPNAFEKMSVSAVDGIYFINIRDIIRCEAEDNYTHIHLRNGDKVTSSKTIKSYEDLLSGVNFYRVHKRHLINLNYMVKFVKGDGGYLIMEDNKQIEVSRRRRPAFMEQMRRLQEGL